jgi:uncharacterized protein
MARLRPALLDEAGAVEVDLQFERAEGSGLRRMHGRLAARVQVACQRCLEPMALELVAEPDLILVGEGEAARLPPEAETLAVEKPVSVAELIEDELLLVLPMIPMHAPQECPARRHVAGAEGAAAGTSPFARLERGPRK